MEKEELIWHRQGQSEKLYEKNRTIEKNVPESKRHVAPPWKYSILPQECVTKIRYNQNYHNNI